MNIKKTILLLAVIGMVDIALFLILFPYYPNEPTEYVLFWKVAPYGSQTTSLFLLIISVDACLLWLFTKLGFTFSSKTSKELKE